MDIDQPCLGVSSHRSIGARLNAGRLITVPALEGEPFSFHINPWNRLRLFMDGVIKFFGGR